MKIWKNKFLKQMIIIIAIFFLIINCIAPSKVYANKSQEGIVENIFSNIGNTLNSWVGFSHSISGDSSYSKASIPGNLVRELFYIFTAIGDVVMSCMQVCFIGGSDMWVDTMLDNKNENLGTEDHNPGSWVYANNEDVTNIQNEGYSKRGSMLVVVDNEALKDGIFSGEWKVPNILLSPENIFANKIAALDANFINPHKYQAISDSEGAKDEAVSFAESISPTIASWYRAFRNIAIVSLLSVLVYIGIRILIGTVSEKAKYKERLTDWFVALCLVFFIHFIMAGIMMLSEKITDLIDNSFNSGIIVAVSDGTIFRTSFTGYIRFGAQSNAWTEAVGYSIMYFVVIGITLRYVFIYLKRALYLAFFTMIAPLVAITYPIDKAGDGKAQAFNIWLKEYFINAIIQPVHLILYSALVGSAISLAVQNPIYGIVVLLFLSIAESWVKKMFKIDQAALTSSSLGDVAILGSMFGMGKSIVGGVAGGVKNITTAAATGGIGAVGRGILGSALGAPVRALGAVAGAVSGRRTGRTPEEDANEEESNETGVPGASDEDRQAEREFDEYSRDIPDTTEGRDAEENTEEDTKEDTEEDTEEDSEKDDKSKDSKSKSDNKQNDKSENKNTTKYGKIDSQKIDIQRAQLVNINGENISSSNGETNKDGKLVKEEKTQSEVKPDIYEKPMEIAEDGSVVINPIDNSLDILDGEEEKNQGASQQRSHQEDNASKQALQSENRNKDENTMKLNNVSVDTAHIDAKGKTSIDTKETKREMSEYEDRMNKKEIIGKLTQKDEAQQVSDQINKALAGMVGGVAGIPVGAFMSGLMGENKMMAAAPMATANIASQREENHIQNHDKKDEKIIKMLVNANVTNNNIIRNATELKKKKNIPDERFVQLVKMAEDLKKQGINLSKDEKERQKIIQGFIDQGVSKEAADKNVKYISQIQGDK